jgi:hypothetical protein
MIKSTANSKTKGWDYNLSNQNLMNTSPPCPSPHLNEPWDKNHEPKGGIEMENGGYDKLLTYNWRKDSSFMSLRGGTCRAGDDEANLGQPKVALLIVRFAHNYTLKGKVHTVNFKTNEVRPACHVALRAPHNDTKKLITITVTAGARY